MRLDEPKNSLVTKRMPLELPTRREIDAVPLVDRLTWDRP